VEYTPFYLYNIGLAIYQQGGKDAVPRSWLEGRVDSLLKLLLNNDRIEINSERLMTVKKPK
jgi:hypothetical protein